MMLVCLVAFPLAAQDPAIALQTHEYITIRWGGRDNTHIIHGDGRVEFMKAVLANHRRPDRVDERAFYMNIAMNAAAKQGYKFVGMTNDEIVMERPLPK